MSETQDVMSVSNDQIVAFGQEYLTQARIVNEENGILRSRVIKRAGNEGIDTKALIAAAKFRKQGDHAAVLRYLNNVTRYYTLLAANEVTPEDIFGGWDSRLSNQAKSDNEIWTAKEAGHHAGRNGVDIDKCPYIPGTELHALWIAWYKDGTKAARKVVGPQGEVAPTVTGKRVRRANGNGQDEPKVLQLPAPPIKRGPGRPKGARNRPHA